MASRGTAEEPKQEAPSVPPKRGVPPEPPELRTCAYCGREINASVEFCPFCDKNRWGRDRLEMEGYYESGEEPESEFGYGPRHASGTLMAGGILAILAGVLALGQGLLYGTVAGAISSVVPSGDLCLCGGLDILFGIASIGAGIFAIERKHFMFAVLGAVLGMLGLGLLIGGLLGLLALVFIAASRNDFVD